jgi:hypothetical protein
MKDRFLAYLLNADEPEDRQQIENLLREQPEETQRELDEAQRLLEPLAADKDEIDPPPWLWVRTLAHVAAHQCRELPRAPLTGSRDLGGLRPWWRRADALVAASILLVAAGLGVTATQKAWYHYRVTQCSANLASFFKGLSNYSDQHGHLPQLKPVEPYNRVGMIVPELHDAGVLPADFKLTCPADDRRAPGEMSVQRLVALYENDPDGFRQAVAKLAGSYAYSLGYWEHGDNGELHYRGLEKNMLHATGSAIPLMGDRPPFTNENDCSTAGNSPNHAARGQNVLFTDGSTRFYPGRSVGLDADIYRNRNKQCAAGLGQSDVVLGAGWATPGPQPQD